jgi:uncharacterized protein
MPEKKVINLANPAPLGLLGFGMTTVLLNMHNAQFFSMDGMILAMGVFYGGIAQIIAGVMEWKKENTFGMTAFISYGLFWLSLVGILVIPGLGLAAKPEQSAMAAYLFMWGLFTVVMFVATLKLNKTLRFVFATLAALFFLLSLGDITGNKSITMLAGYEGMICGFSAIYLAAAEIINEIYKKTVLPM